MQPFMRDAVYSNYLQDEGDERARAAHGSNFPRLASLNRRIKRVGERIETERSA